MNNTNLHSMESEVSLQLYVETLRRGISEKNQATLWNAKLCRPYQLQGGCNLARFRK